MADPITWITIASTAFSVIGQISQASAKSDAADYNAAIVERNATISRQQGEADVIQQSRVNYLRLSKIKAASGASGITQEGSPLDVLESSAAQAELDTQNIRYNASLKAMGYGENAQLNRTSAATAQSQGLYGAAAAGLTGYGKAIRLSGTGTTIPMGLSDDDWS